MNRSEAQEFIEARLRDGGFVVSRRCDVRPGSFDYVARRGDVVLLLKVATNIDSIIEEAAREMTRISRALHALTFIVGERAGQRELSRGTAYFRYGLPSISFETFEDLLEGQPLLVYAAPGGEYVNIEGTRLREARDEKDLSRGELASLIGVSRSMVRRYEEGEANATAQICVRMEEVLNSAIVRPVSLEPRGEPERGKRTYEPDGLERRISVSLSEMGLTVMTTRRAPFNAVSSDDTEMLLTGVSRRARGIAHRAAIVRELSEILETRSVFILKEQSQEQVEDIPLIGVDELSDVEDAGGLFDLIEDRCA